MTQKERTDLRRVIKQEGVTGYVSGHLLLDKTCPAALTLYLRQEDEDVVRINLLELLMEATSKEGRL